ncbi:MarR family winged helix-turn-helix transcriptional regulator [Citrobacter koseri]|uniref:MarR family winged helix-turn-helix transcriptional regulator n=1 Tax=Citrobacter koseri TaxID=545 RepID=UPI002B3D9592|nr:MarR family winged helix-turn-helix transcriptional regulator [Citrobacter koseri]MEB2704030.1 MarR family winged helix-turn-helix transcriptional regulator [Citrobacter koseri]MEB2709589.1 MarR family winged helix-turn-helix transcriptional regulator [Citrobacter koseri]
MRNNKFNDSGLLVELADTTLHIARKLRAYPLQRTGFVPISPLEALVMLHVYKRPGVSPSDLAQELALRSSNAATALRGLVKKGQVERRADPEDKRVARLYLTPTAEEAIVTVRCMWKELLSQADISEEDLHIAVKVLTTINSTLVEP